MSDTETIISLIKHGRVNSVKQLLPPSQTPLPDIILLLKVSIEAKNVDILRYLLDTFKPASEEYLFRYAVIESLNYDRTEEFKVLSEYNPKLLTRDISHTGNALAHAVLVNNIPLASFLLTHGNDPNECRFMSKPPIASATYLRYHAMIKLLIQHGAGINGTHALFMAVESGCVDTLRLLAHTKGVDINMTQPGKWLEEGLVPGPVLHLAVQTKNPKMVRVLVEELGADPLVKDEDGKTAVDWARCIGHRGIRRQLDPTYKGMPGCLII